MRVENRCATSRAMRVREKFFRPRDKNALTLTRNFITPQTRNENDILFDH